MTPRSKCRERLAAAMVAAVGIVLVWLVACSAAQPAAAPSAAVPPSYAGPAALCVSPDAKTLFVANADAGEVAVVALSGNGGSVARRIPTPESPTGVALTPDGARLVVTCGGPHGRAAVFDAATGRPLATIPAGHTAMAPVVSPDGRRLYVCNRFDNDVSVIDLAAGKTLARVKAVREPVAAAVTPDGRTVLAANHLPVGRTDDPIGGHVATVVTAINADTLRSESISLPHGASSVRGLCLTPDGKHAIVTHLLSNFQKVPFRVDMGWVNVNVISVIDLAQRKVVRTIGLDEQDLGAGVPWDVVCADGGRAVCVSVSGTHELAVLDLAGLMSDTARRMTPMMGVWPIYPSLASSQWRRTPLAGKGPRAMAAVGSRVYVAEYFSDVVAVVDVQREDPGAPVSMTAPSAATSASDAASGGDADRVDRSDRGDAPLSTEVATPVGSIALGPAPRWTEARRGEFLFHDATMCYQHWQSCASCHPDGRSDTLNWDLMNDGAGNSKNTKSMLLSHQTPPAMSEGVRMSAEEAVRAGISHILFARRPEADAAAIDAYLKSLRPTPSPHLLEGRLRPAAVRGQALFESKRVGCARCHPAPHYTDLRSHNVNTRASYDSTDRFDSPTLIETWRTAPYLHDGRYATLREVFADGKHGLAGVALSPSELDDLIAFVQSL